MVEDNKNNTDNTDSVSSSDAIMPSTKIDFASFGVKSNDITSINEDDKPHNIIDEMMEDLSIEEDVEVLNHDEELVVEEKKVTDKKEENSEVYINKDEVDKIMNKKESDEPDDFFDEFFE